MILIQHSNRDQSSQSLIYPNSSKEDENISKPLLYYDRNTIITQLDYMGASKFKSRQKGGWFFNMLGIPPGFYSFRPSSKVENYELFNRSFFTFFDHLNTIFQ